MLVNVQTWDVIGSVNASLLRAPLCSHSAYNLCNISLGNDPKSWPLEIIWAEEELLVESGTQYVEQKLAALPSCKLLPSSCTFNNVLPHLLIPMHPFNHPPTFNSLD